LAAAHVTTRPTYRAFANRVKMFLTRDVEWRNRIVSAFREAGLAQEEEQWGLLAMSAFGTTRTWRDVRLESVVRAKADVAWGTRELTTSAIA
jgi:hypothetical protein